MDNHAEDRQRAVPRAFIIGFAVPVGVVFLRLPFETIWGGSLRFDPGGSAGRAREALLSPVS